jgi:hypothetical protein|tara:strand:+ start:233 stop:577 length:345 start_codon:yes stop_codon:yes gene_type:complete
MAYFFQIVDMKKTEYPDLDLTDVVTELQVTMVCDHLDARRLLTVDVHLPLPKSSPTFTAFSDLTEVQTQAWVANALGPDKITGMREQLEAECYNVINGDTSVVSTPPWVTPSGI